MELIKKIFGTKSTRTVKRLMPIVKKINDLEESISSLSDVELKEKTQYFKKLLDEGKTLDDILPEAFAVVREASKRVLNMRHFDVQLIGGIILHEGRIAEMKTGEGKTLVATLPVYLNALTGEGVHIVTVNEYLAKRDSEWMGKVFKFLGLTVGLNLNRMNSEEKQAQYACDVMYTTNNELGFDYLRDNMVMYKEQMVQRPLNFAIVDEIDSILIDEARTPLIISGRSMKSTNLYEKADAFVRTLSKKEVVEEDVKDKVQAEDIEEYDYVVDLKAKSASLTTKGIEKAEKYFGIENYNDLSNSDIVHNVSQALHAHGTMKKDIDYIVKDGEVLIVDEFTGRIMEGRRYSNGLHQALEAKEKVKIADETMTLATITFQNFFRLYDKLSGMTGTALTEEKEFKEIYNLDVVEIPTNVPVKRKDYPDTIYKTVKGKFLAVVEETKIAHEKKQPVLIGTVSIENSEILSSMLKKAGLKHVVLNAKFHEKEAEIIAQAGKLGAITIATNMAGRGTDIMLGGNSEFLAKQEMKKMGRTDEEIQEATSYYDTDNEEVINLRNEFKKYKSSFDKEIEKEKEQVIEAGGLKIIGTERHDSRRIDNQLRGRSGRQGDPGESSFFLSLEDNLMQIFGGEMLTRIYNTLNIDETMPVQVRMVSGAIETAQRRVEGRNFEARKYTLNYDDVMNSQREIIYAQRRDVLEGEDVHENILKMSNGAVEDFVAMYAGEMESGSLSLPVFMNELRNRFNIDEVQVISDITKSSKTPDNEIVKVEPSKVIEELKEKVENILNKKVAEYGETFKELERNVLLQIVDDKWMEHIDTMEDLKNGIGLRGYGQKDPVVQYRLESYDLFDEMNAQIKMDVIQILLHVEKDEQNSERKQKVRITEMAKASDDVINPKIKKAEPIKNQGPKVKRNDPCPCGSGKKYKNCCGK